MFTSSLRGKFLLALGLISALITTTVLLTVRYRVDLRVREELRRDLDTSIVTFGRLQQQRELTLERSAALLAALPTLKALMTSADAATIQDASATFWKLAGSQLFVLVGRDGAIAAFHSSQPDVPVADVQSAADRALAAGASRDWWVGGGHLFQVFLQPIAFGSAETGYPIGVLAVGYEVDRPTAVDVGRVAASDVAFGVDGRLIVSTIDQAREPWLRELVAQRPNASTRTSGSSRELSGAITTPMGVNPPASDAGGIGDSVVLGHETFLMRTVALSDSAPRVTLTVLKSLDEATAFQRVLNRWIVVIGVAGVLVGSGLVFLVSTTFTRPLERLVAGVRALEGGDYQFPLHASGHDEVSALTEAFSRMRGQLRTTQQRLLEAERLATIGRMANTISHDLRHPLTAVLAYAEFLGERDLTPDQRRDCLQEVRIAVNRMTDEINSLLGFSHERQQLQTSSGRLDELIERVVRTVKALPDFEGVTMTAAVTETHAVFDPNKLERALLNLLFNAAEAVSPRHGSITVTAEARGSWMEIRVADNGPGIPEAIRSTLFEPFVSQGKQKGTGLGLTVVQNVLQQHGGDASVERTGPDGTTFLLRLPLTTPLTLATNPTAPPADTASAGA